MSRATDIAWAAGLFEGEGCIFIMDPKGYVYGRASMEQNDIDVISRFHEIVGCGTLVKRQKKRNLARQESWIWYASSKSDFKQAMELLEPYFGVRRTQRLAEVRESIAVGRKVYV